MAGVDRQASSGIRTIDGRRLTTTSAFPQRRQRRASERIHDRNDRRNDRETQHDDSGARPHSGAFPPTPQSLIPNPQSLIPNPFALYFVPTTAFRGSFSGQFAEYQAMTAATVACCTAKSHSYFNHHDPS